MIALTRDSVCFLCGRIDDGQIDVIDGSLGCPAVTAHPSCIEKDEGRMLALKREEVSRKDAEINHWYRETLDAFWSEIEGRVK